MPTLAQLIAAHEARQPAPIAARVTELTPRGHATVAIHRLARQLRALEDRGDRAYCTGLLEHMLDDVADGVATV